MYTVNTEIKHNELQNLCSRKLFELLAEESALSLSRQQLQTIEQELLTRQHYLHELKNLRRNA